MSKDESVAVKHHDEDLYDPTEDKVKGKKGSGNFMCCFCCTSLRGSVYFLVTSHMLGAFYLFLKSIYVFFYPPPEGYPELDVNPQIVAQFPLLVAAYALATAVLGCFIFRAVDMDSVVQMKWSAGVFGGFQGLVILLQFVFTVMFVDILTKSWQAVLVGLLVVNFVSTVAYLCILFLYGKKLQSTKYGRPKLVRNSLSRPSTPPQTQNELNEAVLENNWDVAASLALRKTSNHAPVRPNLNLLENHVQPVVVSTGNAATSTDL